MERKYEWKWVYRCFGAGITAALLAFLMLGQTRPMTTWQFVGTMLLLVSFAAAWIMCWQLWKAVGIQSKAVTALHDIINSTECIDGYWQRLPEQGKQELLNKWYNMQRVHANYPDDIQKIEKEVAVYKRACEHFSEIEPYLP